MQQQTVLSASQWNIFFPLSNGIFSPGAKAQGFGKNWNTEKNVSLTSFTKMIDKTTLQSKHTGVGHPGSTVSNHVSCNSQTSCKQNTENFSGFRSSVGFLRNCTQCRRFPPSQEFQQMAESVRSARCVTVRKSLRVSNSVHDMHILIFSRRGNICARCFWLARADSNRTINPLVVFHSPVGCGWVGTASVSWCVVELSAPWLAAALLCCRLSWRTCSAGWLGRRWTGCCPGWRGSRRQEHLHPQESVSTRTLPNLQQKETT